MNPRTKRPTASDLVPTAKAIKEMSYEEMEALYNHRNHRLNSKNDKAQVESIRTYRNEM